MAKTLICTCNRTMPLDAPAIGRALGETPTLHSALCRREAPAFQQAIRGDAHDGDIVVVACTQESRLFAELAAQTEGVPPLEERPIRFVNIRETAGWSREARQATPKIAALLALAQMPHPEPVPTVSYQSDGRLLVIGPAEAAERAAGLVADVLQPTLLLTGPGALSQAHRFPVIAGRLRSLTGWLGHFTATWEQGNPIALDLCTRCNACVAACPEGAIGLDYQIDLERCRAHRDCVSACAAAGAIDFGRAPSVHDAHFDLVLDLRAAPAFTQHAPPQGYVRWDGRAPEPLLALRELVGEFDKPRFVAYQQRLCAHARNEQVGCRACVDVCSASAIDSAPALKQVEVNPSLCVGCGACTTVCPSGALGYVYPRASEQGKRLRTLLATYARAGGRDAALLVHSEQAGARLVEDLGRAAMLDRSVHGLPARVLPFPVWHTASMGVDLWLSALAFGAAQVWILVTDEEAPQYREALAEQIALAQAILAGLGYEGEHLKLISARDARDLAALDAALRAPPARTVATPATWGVRPDKRDTLEFAIEHLAAHAPAGGATASQPADTAGARSAAGLPGGTREIPLPAAGAPFGTIEVDPQACTLCLSCVGACPEGALLDNPEAPELRFIERTCVQCGLCARTCPEDAIRLRPRLLLGTARNQPRVLHASPPFQCVRCGKPFATAKVIETMLARLSGHAMFQGAARQRLQMCADCRVIDLYSASDETRITGPGTPT